MKKSVNTLGGKNMKITVGELMTKIEEIQYIIDELDKMPGCNASTGASQYLEEYIDRLKDMKVDM
jgi:hypothetical protein